MTNHEADSWSESMDRIISEVQLKEILAEMQGPELGLVGDVAERLTQQGTAEVTKSGERGVGEIVGAPELDEYVACQIAEERRLKDVATLRSDDYAEMYQAGKLAALFELQTWLICRTAKRSDLSNVDVMARPDGGPNT